MSGGLDPRDFTADEIEVREAPTIPKLYGREGETDEWPDNFQVTFCVARKVAPEWMDRRNNWPGDGFSGKVKRTLARLAEEGTIVKRSGMNRGGQPGYATKAYAEEWEARMEAVREALSQADDRFKTLARRGATYGVEAGGDQAGVVLSLDDFERLLDRIGEPW